jgi:MFS superfamily sulfate permease-like transporter
MATIVGAVAVGLLQGIIIGVSLSLLESVLTCSSHSNWRGR